jgi:hypothetical protein
MCERLEIDENLQFYANNKPMLGYILLSQIYPEAPVAVKILLAHLKCESQL